MEMATNSKIITVTLNPCIDKTIILKSFCEGGLNRSEHVRQDVGGKGINVGKVLRNFGLDVLAMGIAGNRNRTILLDELEERGIAHQFLSVSGENRTNYKIFDANKGQITEINEPGFVVSEQELEQFTHLLEKELPNARLLVLSGSVARGIFPDVYGQFIALAKNHGVKTVLDADGELLHRGLSFKPFAIKPNLYELEQYCGKKLNTINEILSCGREILERGISFLAISLGREGAIFMNQDEAWHAVPDKILCKSTVGAGDSMVAAMCYALSEGLPLKEMAQLATAAGTVTASKEGTEVCHYKEVLAWLNKITMERIQYYK